MSCSSPPRNELFITSKEWVVHHLQGNLLEPLEAWWAWWLVIHMQVLIHTFQLSFHTPHACYCVESVAHTLFFTYGRCGIIIIVLKTSGMQQWWSPSVQKIFEFETVRLKIFEFESIHTKIIWIWQDLTDDDPSCVLDLSPSSSISDRRAWKALLL